MKNEIQRSFDYGSKDYDKNNEIQKLSGKILIDFLFFNLTKKKLEIYNKKKTNYLRFGLWDWRVFKNNN